MYTKIKNNTEDTSSLIIGLQSAIKEKDDRIYYLTKQVVRLEFEIED